MDTQTKHPVTSARIRGRWYALMIVLGNSSGRDMSKLMKDKATEIITMLEISNEFPEEFKVVNQLVKIEESLRASEGDIPADQLQNDYLLGALDVKTLEFNNRPWSELTTLSDL